MRRSGQWIEQVRQALHTDHQDVPCLAGAHEARGVAERVAEARAAGGDIVRGGVLHTEFGGHHGAGRRPEHHLRGRGQHDGVDLLGVDPRGGQRVPGGRDAHRDDRLVRLGPTPGGNAGARPDPLVGRVDQAGLTDLLKRADASRNSLYQHFPQGKAQLVETATRIVHSHLSVMADALAGAPSIEQWLDELFAFWREPLESSEYRKGSFTMAAALDELDPAVQVAAGQAFTEWTSRLTDGFVSAGLEHTTARPVAGLLLSVIEGAIVQARALESSTPFDDARDLMTVLLNSHLGPRQLGAES